MHLLTYLTDGSLALTMAAITLIFLGVALPAVWSRKPARRRAATSVLQQILDFLCRPHE